MTKYPHGWVPEFFRRTRANLNYINCAHNPDPKAVFETTQLINSLLGFVVFVSEIEKQQIDFKDYTHRTGDDAVNILKEIRNAIAHGGIEILDDGNEIVGVRFSHQYKRRTIWEGDFSIDQMTRMIAEIESRIAGGGDGDL